jgi:hypothetical protein
MSRETRTLGNQTFQDGNLKAAVDGALVPANYTAVPLSSADTEWEAFVDTFGAVSLANAIVQASEGGGGSSTYTNATQMPTTVGGLAAGSTFDAATMSEMFDGLLYPYQAPAFTSFSISGQSTPIEVGAEIAINRTFLWGTSNSANVTPSSIDLIDVTGGGVTIASGLINDGTEATSYPAAPITKTTPTTHSFRIDGENTQAGTFSGTFTVTWQWKKFYGASVTVGPLIETEIEGLNDKVLSSTFVGTYIFSGGGYKYLCYPASLGEASSFKDESTNLDVPFIASYTVNVTNHTANPQTTSYRVHRTTNIIGSAINIVVS